MISRQVLEKIRSAAADQYDAMVSFARRAIQTKSLPGEEEAMAQLLRAELERVGCDDVWIDDAGNAVGVLRGSGSGKSVQFNSHIDHVSEGDPNLWERPPYAAIVEGDVLYGRAASDVKGGLAAQVYLVPVLRAAGLQPAGDVYIVGVVLEEVGGLGTEWLCKTMPTDFAVLSEATNNEIRRGHRGRVLVEVTMTGRSVHASAPERGANPHYSMARFLQRLEGLEMVPDPEFGGSTVAPTLIRTDQKSGNVTPGSVTLSLDWRSIPSESEDDIAAKVGELAAASCGADVTAKVLIQNRPVRTYTGMEQLMPSTRGYQVSLDHPLVTTAVTTLEAALEQQISVGFWNFGTDGGRLSAYDIPTIGFSPGEEHFAHTIYDQVSISKMRAALVGNAALALELTTIGHD